MIMQYEHVIMYLLRKKKLKFVGVSLYDIAE